MTNETEPREYFIMKRGYYYRPDNCGYTDRPILAGLYTEAEAKATTHPNGEDGPRDGMHYFHKSKCKDADYVAYNAQAARIAELEAERDHIREQRNFAQRQVVAAEKSAEAAEAKLAKAVALAPEILASLDATGCNVSLAADYRTTLAELQKPIATRDDPA